MSVADQEPFNQSTANGVTKVFPYSFKVFAASHLVVQVAGVTVTTGFTVSGVGVEAGGNVTFTTAPANGAEVLIYRDIPLSRSIAYTTNGPFPATTVNKDIDLLWQVLQGLAAEQAGVLRVPFPGTVDDIPDESDRLDKVLGFNVTTGQPEASSFTMTQLANAVAAAYLGGAAATLDALAFLQAGTGAVSRTAQNKARERMSFADFGVVGDGVADDTSKIVAALAAAKLLDATLYSGPGIFKISSTVVIEGINLICEGPSRTRFEFYGTGTAMEWNGETAYSLSTDETKGFTLLSKAAGQNGLHIKGSSNGHKLGSVVIRDFDGFTCKYGVSPTSAVFFADTDYIWCHAQTRTGATGFIVDGGSAPNSNANVFRNVYVGGRYNTLFDIRGNGNVFIGGAAEFYPNLITVSEVFKISGIGNKFIGTYIENGGGTTFPSVIWNFTSTAMGNVFRDLLLQMSLPAGGIRKLISDSGMANDVQSVPTGLNVPYEPGQQSGVNLLHNTEFRGSNGSPSVSAAPFGWFTFGATAIVRDTTTVRGAAASLKLTGTNQAAYQYLYSSTAGRARYNIYPKAYFLGKNMRAGAWVYSATAGVGQVRAGAAGTYGTSTSAAHSGGSAWEFLTTATRVDSTDTTEVFFQARIAAGVTGDAYFSEPVFAVGNELPMFAPAPLQSDKAFLSGRICFAPFTTFTDGDTTPSVLDGNMFNASNSGATTITNFDDGFVGGADPIYVVATNGNTTVANNSNIHTTTGANKVLAADGVYKFLFNGTKWYEF